MRIKRLSKQLFIISLGIFILTAADNIFHSATVYAADTSTISTSSTRSEVQEVVDEGNFDYTQLTDAEIDHIYSIYGNDPETIRQLQKQSDSANPYGVATLSSTTYTRIPVQELHCHEGDRCIGVKRFHQLEQGKIQRRYICLYQGWRKVLWFRCIFRRLQIC